MIWSSSHDATITRHAKAWRSVNSFNLAIIADAHMRANADNGASYCPHIKYICPHTKFTCPHIEYICPQRGVWGPRLPAKGLRASASWANMAGAGGSASWEHYESTFHRPYCSVELLFESDQLLLWRLLYAPSQMCAYPTPREDFMR